MEPGDGNNVRLKGELTSVVKKTFPPEGRTYFGFCFGGFIYIILLDIVNLRIVIYG